MTGFTLIAKEPGFVVIDKAPGIPFHARGHEPGLCRSVAESLGVRIYPVHRLDAATSGLVLMATTREIASSLAALFRDRRIAKYYVALSDHVPRKKQGLIQGDMLRSRRGGWKLARSQTNPARTRFFSWPVRPGLRLFLLKPLTGRTHQLRVALKSLGSPILGDTRYHEATTPWPDRTYLHAHALRFVLNGTPYAINRPPTEGVLFQDSAVRKKIEEIGDPGLLPWPDKVT